MSECHFRIVIVTQIDEETTTLHQDMLYFVAELPEKLKHLLQGPVKIHNGFVQYIFASAGGKYGRHIDTAHREACGALMSRHGHSAVLLSWTEDGIPRADFGPDLPRRPSSLL